MYNIQHDMVINTTKHFRQLLHSLLRGSFAEKIGRTASSIQNNIDRTDVVPYTVNASFSYCCRRVVHRVK